MSPKSEAWKSPAVRVLFGDETERLVQELEDSISYYRHNRKYAEEHASEYGPTVVTSEAAVNAVRYIVAYSEMLRVWLQPYWYGMESSDVQSHIDVIHERESDVTK